MSRPELLVTASPHLSGHDSTPKIMWHVVLSLLPVVAVSGYYFGVSALLVILAASIGCLLTERLFGSGDTIGDGSAVITGLLLGLCLPAVRPRLTWPSRRREARPRTVAKTLARRRNARCPIVQPRVFPGADGRI